MEGNLITIRKINLEYQQHRQIITSLITQAIQHDDKHNETIQLIHCLRELDCNYKQCIKLVNAGQHTKQPEVSQIATKVNNLRQNTDSIDLLNKEDIHLNDTYTDDESTESETEHLPIIHRNHTQSRKQQDNIYNVNGKGNNRNRIATESTCTLNNHNKSLHGKEDEVPILEQLSQEAACNGDLFCCVCNKTLKSKEELLQHIQNHGSEFCDECDNNYLIIKDIDESNTCFIKHKFIKDYYDKNLKACDYCTFNTLIENEHKAHLELYHANRLPFKCKHCLKGFKYHSYLLDHLQTNQHETKDTKKPTRHPYKCYECDQFFGSRSAFNTHRDTHRFTHKCKDCGKCFTSGPALGGHRQIHRKNKPNPKKSKSKPMQSKSKIYKCKDCGKCFASGPALGGHRAKSHRSTSNKSRPIASNKSHHTTSNNVSLLKHDYDCKICKREFKTRDLLLLHLDIHLRGICDICHIKYGVKVKDAQRNRICIDKHELMQEYIGNNKVLKCGYESCSFISIISNNMRHHRLSHPRNEEIHSCPQCSYSTRSKRHYLQHLLTHTSEKPFKCSRCNVGFKNLDNLDKHIANVHERKKGNGYSRANELQQSTKSHTGTNGLLQHQNGQSNRRKRSRESIKEPEPEQKKQKIVPIFSLKDDV